MPAGLMYSSGCVCICRLLSPAKGPTAVPHHHLLSKGALHGGLQDCIICLHMQVFLQGPFGTAHFTHQEVLIVYCLNVLRQHMDTMLFVDCFKLLGCETAAVHRQVLFNGSNAVHARHVCAAAADM